LQQEGLIGQSSAEIIAVPGTQRGQNEEDELAIALELSKSESTRLQTVLEGLDNQEEEDLAQAMAESLKTTANRPPAPAHQPSDIISPIPQEPTTPIQSPPPDDAAIPTSNGAGSAPRIKGRGRLGGRVMRSMPVLTVTSAAVAPSDPVDDPCVNDEAIARRLAEEDRLASRSPGNSDARLTVGGGTSPSFSRSQSVPFTASFITNDETYARTLAEQEAGIGSTARARSKSAIAYSGLRSSKISELPPPYEVSPLGLVTNPSEPDSSVAGDGSVPSQSRLGSEISSTRFLRALPGPPEQSVNESAQSPTLIDRSVSSTSLSSPAAEWGIEDSPSPSAALNPYVTDELLKGVCESST